MTGHAALAAGRWSTLTLAEQLANVGSEVERTITAWEARRTERFDKALTRALELFDLTAGMTAGEGIGGERSCERGRSSAAFFSTRSCCPTRRARCAATSWRLRCSPGGGGVPEPTAGRRYVRDSDRHRSSVVELSIRNPARPAPASAGRCVSAVRGDRTDCLRW